MRCKSFTYNQIIEIIKSNHGIKLPKSTISYWTRGISSPVRAGHSFKSNPKPELAYVIGVETGDGSLSVRPERYQYRIRLKAVDVEFVEAFNQAIAKVLGCPPNRLGKETTSKETYVEFGSYLLHKFLSQRFETLKVFVEHDRECAAAFIKGFFDSEGCVEVSGKLTASNNDLALLRYVQKLLNRFFRIDTTGPHLGKKKGTILTRRGKLYKRNADCYFIYVRRASLPIFYQEIGFTIQRKKIRLHKALSRSTIFVR